jgi:hypothetical protein
MKICPVEAELLHADRQTLRRKKSVFANFAKVPNKTRLQLAHSVAPDKPPQSQNIPQNTHNGNPYLHP